MDRHLWLVVTRVEIGPRQIGWERPHQVAPMRRAFRVMLDLRSELGKSRLSALKIYPSLTMVGD
jgi:hypothetical protein